MLTFPRKALILALAAIIALALGQASPLQDLDLRIGDWQRGLLARDRDFSDVIVVDVDEASMRALESQLGAWPYERKVYALVHDYLHRAGARVIAYDILFSDARGAEGDLAFAQALRSSSPAALAGVLSDTSAIDSSQGAQLQQATWKVRGFLGKPANSALLPASIFSEAAAAGIINVQADLDGYLRQIPLVLRVGKHYLPSLPLLALAAPDGTTDLSFSKAGHASLGDRSWDVNRQQRVRMDFPRNSLDLPVWPFYRVVLAALGAEGYELPPDEFKDRAVFIGSTAAILGDYVYVPGHGRVPGLAVVTLAYHALKHNYSFRDIQPVLQGLVLLLVVLPLLFLNNASAWTLRAGMAGVAAGWTLSILAQFGILLLWRQQAWLVTPSLYAVGLAILGISAHARRMANERDRMERSALAAKEASELKGRFLSYMTHELRTPLTAILGYNRLQGSRQFYSDNSQFTAIIDRSARHLLDLINNILDQSKIEAGQMALAPKPTVLRELIAETLELLGDIANRKGLTLKADVAETVPDHVNVDPLRLRQILINLIGNGLKFTRQGGVTISLNWKEGRLSIDITDTGPGIPAEAMKKLFVAFQQASPSVAAEHGGTGLGLVISKNLAQMMGGSVSARSTPGEGTTFSVELEAPAIEPPKPAATTAPSFSGNVLLVGNDMDGRNLLGLYLKQLNLDTRMAENVEQAQDLIVRRKPDLILVDLLMPQEDGIEAARKLRAAGYEGPIIALSAHADTAEHSAARSAGCTDVLVKPISAEALRVVLDRHLQAAAQPT